MADSFYVDVNVHNHVPQQDPPRQAGLGSGNGPHARETEWSLSAAVTSCLLLICRNPGMVCTDTIPIFTPAGWMIDSLVPVRRGLEISLSLSLSLSLCRCTEYGFTDIGQTTTHCVKRMSRYLRQPSQLTSFHRSLPAFVMVPDDHYWFRGTPPAMPGHVCEGDPCRFIYYTHTLDHATTQLRFLSVAGETSERPGRYRQSGCQPGFPTGTSI
ncbi:hypothetical protein BDP55DRAFT_27245 [Colletotrichum godetiae]|uniref:Uncharacterized protein n=1 Tax=Colletotrichum godetiae TaxID=1209918 RepID=A0AAJ0AS25_9PEZI|nr:uncharacterized protein BDP55DRAFT_27245 [Colletotrichum godetiae]KAK1688703.1 hypothetical protein BDP55DRAFT_27245 [Colletotrichum godetiae]